MNKRIVACLISIGAAAACGTPAKEGAKPAESKPTLDGNVATQNPNAATQNPNAGMAIKAQIGGNTLTFTDVVFTETAAFSGDNAPLLVFAANGNACAQFNKLLGDPNGFNSADGDYLSLTLGNGHDQGAISAADKAGAYPIAFSVANPNGPTATLGFVSVKAGKDVLHPASATGDAASAGDAVSGNANVTTLSVGATGKVVVDVDAQVGPQKDAFKATLTAAPCTVTAKSPPPAQ